MSPLRSPRRRAGALTLSLLAALAVHPAGADEVRLANGDRLTGAAVRLDAGVLTFKTAYAGELKIDWSQVVAVATDGPVRLVLDDESRLEGVVSAPPAAAGTAEEPEAPGEASAPPRLAIAAAGAAAPVEVPLAAVRAINPEIAPKVKVSGSLSAGLLASRGNSETDTAYAEGGLAVRRAKDRYRLDASIKESEDGGTKTASRTYGSLRYDRFLGERWYFNANASATEDEFQDLRLRTTLGVATGYQVFDSERTRLALELGASVVDEDFLVAPDDRYPAARWSLDFARKLAGARVELFHRHEGLVGLEDTADLLLRTQTGARFALVGKLVAATQFNLDYDKSPSPGRQTTDRSYLATLGFEW